MRKDNLNKTIETKFVYNFDVLEQGLYLIEIIASARSWWQNLIGFNSFFNDDDLAVKIDNVEFPKLNNRRGLFDGEAAWNGNNLKGLSKTDVIIVNLSKGNHALNFLADQSPIVKSVNIFKNEKEKVTYAPTENNPSQGGNRRQWMTIVLANLSLKNISIKATATKKEFDDEDIKIIIDGKIKTNNDTKWHKNWYWCGRILRGQEKDFSQDLNFPKGLHYIELWADKTPEIKNLMINLGKDDQKPEEKNPEYIIKQVQDLYREIGQEIEFSKVPSPLEVFNKYDKETGVASNEFSIEPAILKATIAQESSFGNVIGHDYRYIGESGLMGLEKKNSIAQLAKLGYTFNYNGVQDVIRASAAYYKWLISIELGIFKDTRNPLKLYTQYSKDLKARNTKAPGIKEFLYYYFYYKQ